MKYETVKRAVYHERGVQLDKLFKPTVTNTLNSHKFWRIRSTLLPRKDAFLNM